MTNASNWHEEKSFLNTEVILTCSSEKFSVLTRPKYFDDPLVKDSGESQTYQKFE